MGYSLDDAPAPSTFGYKCPWCPTTVVEAPLGQALTVFELHLDEHFAAPSTPPTPPRPRGGSTSDAAHTQAAA